MTPFQTECIARTSQLLERRGVDVGFAIGGPDPFVAIGEDDLSDYMEASFSIGDSRFAITIYDDEAAFQTEGRSYIAERQDFDTDDELTTAFLCRLDEGLRLCGRK